jgi:hypothetical protein
MRFFGRKRGTETPPPAAVYTGLRHQVLRLAPDDLGDDAFADEPILALMMETGYPEAVATLVAVVDGTTSLYFSNGGGFIGAGTHAAVAEASRRWLETGNAFLPQLLEMTEPPPPSNGLTQFVAVTWEGIRGGVASEKELGQGGHSLSPLFYAAQDVITEIRLAEGG